MIKGTTPTHVFMIPLLESEIKTVEITYSQDDKEILQKHTEDCVIEDGAVTVKLSQEETFAFDHKKRIQCQIRILTTSNEVQSSKVKLLTVEQCLSDEVLS